jgi:hypothetical protein
MSNKREETIEERLKKLSLNPIRKCIRKVKEKDKKGATDHPTKYPTAALVQGVRVTSHSHFENAGEVADFYSVCLRMGLMRASNLDRVQY